MCLVFHVICLICDYLLNFLKVVAPVSAVRKKIDKFLQQEHFCEGNS